MCHSEQTGQVDYRYIWPGCVVVATHSKVYTPPAIPCTGSRLNSGAVSIKVNHM